jgi:hypothetical protein
MKKKTVILTVVFALFISVEPALAWDNWGAEDDFFNDDTNNWDDLCDGSVCLDEVVVTGEWSEQDNWWNDWWDNWWNNSEYGDDYDDDRNEENWGTGNPGSNGGGGSGSGSGSSEHVPTRKNSLPDAVKLILQEKLEEMLDYYCTYREMYDYLIDHSAEYSDIDLDADNVVVGGYDACNKKLLFVSGDAINEAFPEEFIHFFQDYYYSAGLCAYYDGSQRYNIEFEAKFTQDLMNWIAVMAGNRGGMNHYGEGNDFIDQYWKWIDYLVNPYYQLIHLDISNLCLKTRRQFHHFCIFMV